MTHRAVAPAVALLILGGFVAAMATVGDPSYTLTDLGPGTANAVNGAGSVVGSKPAAGGSSRAYIWTSASQTQTDLGIADSSANGVNDSGVVVGAMTVAGDQHAFLWASGSTTDLGTLDGFYESSAADVNASGQIAGTCWFGFPARAFLWSGGSMSDLGTLGGSRSEAAAVNDAGKVVGNSLLDDELTRHAFTWESGVGMTALGDLDGNNGSEATDVNDAGDVVGSSFTAGYVYYGWYAYWVEGPSTATLWQNGVPVALGGLNTHAFGVNDATADHGIQVIGDAYDETCQEFMPVMWEVDAAGQVTSRVLDESLNATFTGYLERTGRISDAGQIAVSGSTSTFDPRAFLLTPSAQPAVVQPLHAVRYFSATAGVERVSLSWSGVCDAETYIVQRGTAQGGPYQTIATGLTQTSYVDTTAPLGATYHYVVAAVKGPTTGALSADAAAAPVPYAPTNLTAKALNGKQKGQVTLNWTASASGGIAHYKVFRRATNGVLTLVATTGNVTSYTVTGLAKRTKYQFVVSAVHTGGQESAVSNIVTVTARDAAGNKKTDVLTVTYTATSGDTTPPTITISGPTSATTYTTTKNVVTLGGTSSDNRGVTAVTWTNSRGGTGFSSGTTSWSVPSVALQSGTNVITVTAQDAAGNKGTDVITVTYSTTTTQTPPPSSFSLSGQLLTSGSWVRASLQWSQIPPASVEIYLNNRMVKRTTDDGNEVLSPTGSAPYIYKVCYPETTTCSNDLTLR